MSRHALLRGTGRLGLIACAWLATGAAPLPDRSAQPGLSGKALFAARGCYQCHGLAGQGSVLSGPILAGRGLSTAAIAAYTRAPRGVMPAFGHKVLSDGELAAIAAYVAALPAGRPASDIPQLARFLIEPAKAAPQPALAAGQPLYATHCAACHGANREGGAGPSLTGIGQRRSADAIAGIVMAPPPGMPSLSPRPLGPAQVGQIAAYLAAAR